MVTIIGKTYFKFDNLHYVQSLTPFFDDNVIHVVLYSITFF
ncbi:hypothetical protein CI610_02947 [invertebrate metagenome]|uniref:Uncharacterized protein n=1 Tax=invertebrate metagenome TaxID=1711999 RepID=A0A2H9T4G9_9ZZZZ